MQRCDAFQRFTSGPIRFKVSPPAKNNFIVGNELSTELTFLERSAVLHIKDSPTRFSEATILDSHGCNYGQSVN